MSNPDDYATVDFVKVIHDTGKATLVLFDEIGKVWIPNSQIETVDHEGQSIVVRRWFCEKEGLV